MKNRTLLCTTLGITLAFALPSVAQEKGYWRAASTTARSITGDIALSDRKVTLNFAAFTIAEIRTLTVPEAQAVFHTDPGTGSTEGTGSIYALTIPGSKQFLHHNTLCGADDTQYMVTYAAGRDLQIAFFSGAKLPTLTAEALANTTNLCGTFSYIR